MVLSNGNSVDSLIAQATILERERILALLKGIDLTEEEGGWWETSTGANFGKDVINKIIGITK